MITQALHKIIDRRESLTREEAREVMGEVLSGGASQSQICSLLVALRMKEETVEEIVGFAEAIRAAAAPLSDTNGAGSRRSESADPSALDVSGTERDALVDTCGTGGDSSNTFNISTLSALIVAGAGVRVAKHGNRSVTSKCGSADVMEALGVKIDMPWGHTAECLREVGIAFLFAPAIHTAMRHVQPARKELRLRTVFNLLGPLTNPVGASAQVVGVYSEALVPKLAEVFVRLGVKRALVVHGHDGLDEITISGPSTVGEVRDGAVKVYQVAPEDFGIGRGPLDEISGGDAPTNAALIGEVLDGKKSARRDVGLMNACAALFAAGESASLTGAMKSASHSLDSGNARKKLKALAEFTHRY